MRLQSLAEVRHPYLVWFSGASFLLSAKLDILDLSEKLPSCNYEFDVDMNIIYKFESYNYDNSNMT